MPWWNIRRGLYTYASLCLRKVENDKILNYKKHMVTIQTLTFRTSYYINRFNKMSGLTEIVGVFQNCANVHHRCEKYFYLLSFSVSSVFIVSPFSDILKSLKSKCLFFWVCFTHSRLWLCLNRGFDRFSSQKGTNGLFLLFRSRNNLSFWLEQNSLYSD